MDVFAGYNQIWMAPEDEEDIIFVTDKGIYCYKIMLFGLKNIGATYQRLVNKIFKVQIGQNMKVYIDDILVKSLQTSDHIRDLKEAFSTLQRHQMKLNSTKYAFIVTFKKFCRSYSECTLDWYFISSDVIEVCRRLLSNFKYD